MDKVVLTSPSAPDPATSSGQATGPNQSATGQISTNETRTTISYSYDKLYRLTDTEYSGGISASYEYEYDKVGNMVAYTDTVAAQTTIHTRVFNAMNQMTAETQVGVGTKTISYDPNGNMVRIDPAPGTAVPIKFYTYNQRNLMTSAQEQGAALQTVATFRYDGNNDRLEQVAYENGSVATTTTYTNDTIGLTQVLVSDGGPSNTVYQLYGNSLIGQQNGGSALFDTFITDGLGSVRVEMESSGAINYVRTYSPFGETLKEEGARTSVYGYTGQQEDESTGLIYLRARYYSAELKLFTAYDIWQGINTRPGSLNHYAYAEGNPILYADPTGHCVEPISGAICLTAGGVIVAVGIVITAGVVIYLAYDFATDGPVSQFVSDFWDSCVSFFQGATAPVAVPTAPSVPVQQNQPTAQPQGTIVPPILTPQPQPTPSPTPQKQYSLDTNALIALEKWVFNADNSLNGSSLETKVNGRQIYISNVAKNEFLRGTHPNTKTNYNTLIRKYSITEVSNVPSSTLTQITQIAQKANVNVTKQNTVNDLKILASAIGVNSKLLSKEKKLIELFPAHVESW